jgi:hypothetical protein
VCSQIRHEALTLYWTTATFDVSFHSSRRLADKVFGHDNSLLITSIVVGSSDAKSMAWYASGHMGPLFVTQEKDVFPALRRVHVQHDVIDLSTHTWRYANLLLDVRSYFGIADLEITVDKACRISDKPEGI